MTAPMFDNRPTQRQATLLIVRNMIDAAIAFDTMEKTFEAAVADRALLSAALGLAPGEPLLEEER